VKNLFAIAFSCVYLTLTVGVAKTTHYCMGRENHTSLFSFYTAPCACSELVGKLTSCCDNESELLKVDSDQNTVSAAELGPVQMPIIEIVELSILEVDESRGTHIYNRVQQRPPPLDFVILNCSLIFYDDESELSA
jgi:hypothetical protein